MTQGARAFFMGERRQQDYRWSVRKLVALMLLCVSSCGACDKTEAPPPAPTLAAEPPVAVPANVIAEFVMTTPDATWNTLQTLLGGTAALAPPTVGGLMLSSVGVDSAQPGLDTKQPLYGLVVGTVAASDAHRNVWCLHATSTGIASLRSALVESDTAKLKASGSEQSIEILEPKNGGKRFVGLAHGNFVIFAASREDIANFGPYTYRTMPTKPVPKPAIVATVSHDTLANMGAGWIASHRVDLVKQLTDFDDDLRKDHGGRAPDFGDPKPLIDLFDTWGKNLGAAVGTLEHAELDADVDVGGLHATVTLSPQKEGAARDLVASMRPGDALPLLDAPAGVAFTAMMRSDPAERLSNATGAADTISAVTDKRISASDSKSFADALQTIAKTRGDYFLLSLNVVGTPGITLTTRVSDDSKALRAASVIVDAGVRPPFYGLLQSAGGVKSQSSATVDLPPLGKGRLFTFEREAKSGSLLGPTLQLGFGSKDGVLGAAFAPDAPAMLKFALSPEHRAGDDPKANAAIGRLGRDCTFAAIFVPSALSSSGGSDAMVIGWGKRGDDAFASIEAGNLAARQIITQATQGL